MANVAIFLATGYEETEMISTVDVIRRAEQMFKGSFPVVDIVSISDKKEVTGSHGITIKADKTIQEINFDSYDCLILPGGQPGVNNLMESETLMKNLKTHGEKGKTIAAICAAPQILGKLGLADNKEITHYPGSTKYLENATLKPHMTAIEDGNIITGCSIGGALQFGLQIVDHFTSTEQRLKLHETLVFNY
ncbi:DJ-1 family glyoxalase III [Spiroplasma tabanidicola]|uniref:4-methyl-5(B-hydroxyethyl)-thiazole monophosphate biosynthesis protein n=1 Tax=Spiroplasma tabanidicola TaxID=324079 RepID=A0A6I6CIC1_9MOLU|nr:DJ-1 family glyoxalase III [Spiroplasma tabanidicola]QGS51813.1 4-methyl-5(b-hydroxyethyl)-thiazole monophosphate biosynthesis protein [Spiroplasma tabanidicola]